MGVLRRYPVYRRLFAAQVIALVGTGLVTVALALLAHDLAGPRAGQVLGTALAVKMGAYVLVAPIAGAVADRVPRRALMIGADAVRAAVTLALPLVTETWQVYALVAVLQAASATFTPTFQSILPDVIDDDRDYATALSMSQFAVGIENVAGPLLTAVLLLVLDFRTLFVGTAAGFVVSAALVFAAAVPVARRSTRDAFVERLTTGVRSFAGTPRLRSLMGFNMVVAGAGAITLVSTVNVVRDTLGGGEPAVAALLAAAGAGTAAAAVGTPRLLAAHGRRRVMLGGAAVAVAATAASVVLSLAPSWPGAVAVWLSIGAAGGLLTVPAGEVVRSSVAPADRPAAFAAQFALSHLCWLLTYPLAGRLGAAAGFTVAWATLALLTAVAAEAARRAWPRDLATCFAHAHGRRADPDHVDHAAWDGHRWVHTHHVVIDEHHPRWPVPTA